MKTKKQFRLNRNRLLTKLDFHQLHIGDSIEYFKRPLTLKLKNNYNHTKKMNYSECFCLSTDFINPNDTKNADRTAKLDAQLLSFIS